MADEPVGHCPRQRARAPLDATEVEAWRSRLGVGARVEVGLQPGQVIVRTLVGGRLARCERREGGSDRTHIVSEAPDGVLTEGHGVAVFDVLADLCPEAKLEAAPAQLCQVPRCVRDQSRTPREGQRDARPHGDPAGVLCAEERDGQPVVHRLCHVQPVVAEPLHPPGVLDSLTQRQTRVHARIDLHAGAPPSSPVFCSLPRATIFSRSPARRLWSNRFSIQPRDQRFSAARASAPERAPISA